MTPITNLSNRELRIALATDGEVGWTNLHVDANGNLVGMAGALSFAAMIVPNWPETIADAMRLEELLRQKGLLREYISNLAAVTRADLNRATGLYAIAHASARQRSEAALATIRATAIC